MTKVLRQPTLQTLGLGSVIEIFQQGRLPVGTADLVEQIFGEPQNRGSLVISGINGIVGAGKAMQLGSRLATYGVTIVGLDFPGVPDGVGRQYPGLVQAFGKEDADSIMSGVVRLTYDGVHLPPKLAGLRPGFLLEAVPEILSIKKAHYAMFREAFPDIEIRSVTSGFPSSELGVGVAHPAFPHEINKIWETVEPEPSAITQLLWSLGLVPVPVSDNWSFVLDVLFCGITLAGLRYHQATNMPFWKIDKYIRKLVGPNPFRAHDAIGAQGANFLTWSCLHHLSETYGDLFKPTPELVEGKESGQNWYPPNHFRPLVNWSLDAETETDFENWILGAFYQMASLLLQEKRGHLAHINAIGELCAQFRQGVLASIRNCGSAAAVKRVEAYHKLHPQAAAGAWFPETFSRLEEPEWQQLYVNAEHDGEVGVITISRESYNSDVDSELNRALDWLQTEQIRKVILTGDFHLSTQMVGADTNEFFPALRDEKEGFTIAHSWSLTARRFHDEFQVSVGFVAGKRCLGGFLELLMHCHYLVATTDTQVGMPEVTLPVVPGMEGCHWPFRKCPQQEWPQLVSLLLTGRSRQAGECVGWLLDYAGSLEDSLAMTWKIAKETDHGLTRREVVKEALETAPATPELPPAGNQATEEARQAIFENIRRSCAVPLAEAIKLQAQLSAQFMGSDYCRKGVIGAEYRKVMEV